MSQPLRIFDTGTRPLTAVPDGVDVCHQPALVREPLPVDDADVELLDDNRCHVLFYSRFAVRCVADRLDELDSRHRIWAVGPKTASVVESTLNRSAEVPEEHQFTGLRAALLDCGDPRPVLAFGLRGTDRDLGPVAGTWEFETRTVDVYESNPAPPGQLQTTFEEHDPHWLTVTSSKGARSVVEALQRDRLAELQTDQQLRIAAIGPSTASTIRQLGLDVDLVPDEPDREGLVAAIAARQLE